MRTKKMVSTILGTITIVAPILTFVADTISKEREMDEIADRVVLKLQEKEQHVSEKEEV